MENQTSKATTIQSAWRSDESALQWKEITEDNNEQQKKNAGSLSLWQRCTTCRTEQQHPTNNQCNNPDKRNHGNLGFKKQFTKQRNIMMTHSEMYKIFLDSPLNKQNVLLGSIALKCARIYPPPPPPSKTNPPLYQ